MDIPIRIGYSRERIYGIVNSRIFSDWALHGFRHSREIIRLGLALRDMIDMNKL